MGITSETLYLIESAIKLKGSHLRMLELGNQWIFSGVEGLPARTPAKVYLQSLGIEHVSVDINGEDGALKMDLSKPSLDILGEFDVVTNYGTLEHVVDIYYGYKFMHDHCKINGLMLHTSPCKGNWKHHGYHYVDTNVFSVLSKLNNYKILRIDESYAQCNYISGKEVRTIIEKVGNSEFMCRDDFYSKCGITKE